MPVPLSDGASVAGNGPLPRRYTIALALSILTLIGCALSLPRAKSTSAPRAAHHLVLAQAHDDARLVLPPGPAAEDLGSILEPNEKSDPRELPPPAASPGRLPRPTGASLRPLPDAAARACWPAAPRLRC